MRASLFGQAGVMTEVTTCGMESSRGRIPKRGARMLRLLLWIVAVLVLALLPAGCGSSSSNTWHCTVSCNGGPLQNFTITAPDDSTACTQAVMNAGCGP